MAYNYNVELEIANDKARGGFDFKNIEPQVIAAIAQYHALNTARNKKNLSYRITPTILEMSISSPIELKVPSKSLAKFTRILMGLSPTLTATIVNDRVFQSVKTTVPASDMDNYSSCETLKKLIEIFCNDSVPEDTQKRNERLEMQRNIKTILFNVQ